MTVRQSIAGAFCKQLYELAKNDVSWKLKLVADKLDVAVDGPDNGPFQVYIYCGQSLIKTFRFSPSRGDTVVEVGNLLQKNLGVVCAVYQAEFEKLCPGSIKGVEAVREDFDNSITLTVKFKNGHYVQAPEREVESDEFKARCLMLYDLPAL